ncbi:Proteoglycan 4 [Rhizoctonia solani]|uniref:Proteoglycan 4 n=1 Tax=Rhizoctonia solani TaxID=456999 RepID=A0A0K6FLS7_9AGAM|nr:Proteoglycan 4 [Rhizoctonia solani]
METSGRKITAKVEPSLIHSPGQSRPASRAASPLVTRPLIDPNDSTPPTPTSVRPKAKITSSPSVGSLRPPPKPTGPNATGRKTPASSSLGRSARDRPVSLMGTPSKPPFGRSTTPSSKRAMSPQLRTGPDTPSPEPSSRVTPRTTRPTVKPTSPPLKSVPSKPVPARRTQPPPPTGNRNKSPVRAPPLSVPRQTSPTRPARFKAPSPTVHRRIASASASSSVVSGGGDPSPSPGDLARARHKVPSSLSSINLTQPSIFSSPPASPPTSTYPALASSQSSPTLNHNPSDLQDSSPEPTDLSAPPSAVPSELLAEEPTRAIVSAPVTPIHVQARTTPVVDRPITRPRTSSVTIVDGDTERPRPSETLPTLGDTFISTSKDIPSAIRIKAKLTPTTPPNNPAAKTIAHVRPDQLVVPRPRSGSISAGSSFSGLGTSTLSRASSVRVTSASRILSPPLLRSGPALGLMVPGASILVPPGMRSPPMSNLSSTTSSSSGSSAHATSIDRARTPMESGVRAKITAVPSKLGLDEESVDRDDSGIDMFEADDQREEARSNRKIADLEISNKSLLAINASLEATKSRQAKEIEELRCKLRESRLMLPHTAYLALEQQDPLEPKGAFEEEDEEEDVGTDEVTQTQVNDTFDRVRGLLDGLLEDAKKALESKPPEPPNNGVPVRKPIRVLDVEELQQYADRETDDDDEEDEDESGVTTATESVTDLAESIDEDSPSALAEKAALTTPKHRSSFSVGVGVGVGVGGLFGGWGSR